MEVLNLPKMEVLNLTRLFWGRIHTAYIGDHMCQGLNSHYFHIIGENDNDIHNVMNGIFIIYHINLWRCFRNSTATSVSNNYHGNFSNLHFYGLFHPYIGGFSNLHFSMGFWGSKGIRRRQQNTQPLQISFSIKNKKP